MENGEIELERPEATELQELSEAVRHEQAEVAEVGAPLPSIYDHLQELCARVVQHRAVAIFLFDASRLGEWERQFGHDAFDAVMLQLGMALRSIARSLFGPSAIVCLDAPGGDMIYVFPERGALHAERSGVVDLEDQLHQLHKRLLEHFASHSLSYQEAVESVASGSSVILESGAVDARIAYGEMQRKRNRIVGHVIAHQKLRTLFQPLVSLPSGVLYGYEALSRPLEREAAKLGVHLFIAASRAALDGELDATCRALSMMRRPPLQPHERLFINCLPSTFYDKMTDLELLLDHWAQAGLEPAQLVFEVTESITAPQLQRILPNVRALEERGYRFALDDVGTGMSNMHLIVELAPRYLKMDMSLTIGIAQSERKRRLAAYLLELAHKSGAELIAEGIESEGDLEAIRALGITIGQGYLLGRPAEIDALACAEERS